MIIASYAVVKVHDDEPRELRKCTFCEKRRLTTKITFLRTDTRDVLYEYFCNGCLTATPNWS